MSVSGMRSPANPSPRRAAVERAILDATEQLLASGSFHALTVEDVMRTAGLTRTAFYRYFPDLESVLLRRLAELRQDLGSSADLWLDHGSDPRRAILDATTGLAGVYSEHGRILLAFADAAGRGPGIEQAWHQAIDSFVAPVVSRIRDLTARGLCRIDDPVEIARALVWMTERYLLETFGRSAGGDVAIAARTLTQIWERVLFA